MKKTTPPGRPLSRGTALLPLLMGFAAFMAANSVYLLGVELRQQLGHTREESATFQYVFASHLLVGVAFAVIALAFLAMHVYRLRSHGNRLARRRGLLLAGSVFALIVSGVLLVRSPGLPDLSAGFTRSSVYALHVLLPVIMVLMFAWHRRAGSRPLRREARLTAVAFSVVGAALILWVMGSSPGPAHRSSGAEPQTFVPSLMKLAANAKFDAADLDRDEYCQRCHADVHARWQASAHRNSSFNNPFYAAAVHKTRERMVQRDGSLAAARFCAGCHDPIPLATGDFDLEEFNAVDFPSASAGLTCTVCHSVSSVDSPRGNADFTITPPVHYPFAFSESGALRWLSDLLVQSNPDFHKRTFLKPLHRTADFCGACHKVHIPESLNAYRWLRGQNHYDSFLQSGVAGHKIDSFYYPEKASINCNECHMPAIASDDRGASAKVPGGTTTASDHLFAAGNTALPFVLKAEPYKWIREHDDFLKDALTLDIVGFRDSGAIDGEFIPAADFADRALAGREYLAELVVRTRGVGHAFTEGTTDSNQVWVELSMLKGDRVLASSGKINPDGSLDEMSAYTVRNYVVDRDGRRILHRNVEDIHTAVYRRQIPPGAADVVHYRFRMPAEGTGNFRILAKLLYRKFDSEFRKYSLPEAASGNDLPVLTISHTEYTTVQARDNAAAPDETVAAELNDYGIALYRKNNRAQFRQAEAIFRELDSRNYAPAQLNLARLLLADGRVDDATEIIERLDLTRLDNPWTALWFAALIDLQNGFVSEAINKLRRLVDDPPGRAIDSGFDFGKDYVLLETLGNALIMQSLQAIPNSGQHQSALADARSVFEALLDLEPERVSAHQALMRIATLENDDEAAQRHREAVERFKVDEYAQSRAASLAREKNAHLDKLAGSIVIYDLTEADKK